MLNDGPPRFRECLQLLSDEVPVPVGIQDMRPVEDQAPGRIKIQSSPVPRTCSQVAPLSSMANTLPEASLYSSKMSELLMGLQFEPEPRTCSQTVLPSRTNTLPDASLTRSLKPVLVTWLQFAPAP